MLTFSIARLDNGKFVVVNDMNGVILYNKGGKIRTFRTEKRAERFVNRMCDGFDKLMKDISRGR